jgi:hypothetical protein
MSQPLNAFFNSESSGSANVPAPFYCRNQRLMLKKSHSPYGLDDFLPWIRGSDRVRDTNKELMPPVSEFHLFVYGSSDR